MPEFQEELSQLGASAFFREAFVALIRSANSLVATREVINQGEAILRQAQWEVAEARARAKRTEEALEAGRTNRATELEEAISRVDAKAKCPRAALNQLGDTMGAITTRDYRINALTTKVQAAEERAEHVGKVARRADSHAAEREATARRAEAAVIAAERRAAEAVDEFHKSTSFIDELADASVDVYLQGFQDYREKVARVLGLPSVADIEPDEVSDEPPSDDGPTAAEP